MKGEELLMKESLETSQIGQLALKMNNLMDRLTKEPQNIEIIQNLVLIF